MSSKLPHSATLIPIGSLNDFVKTAHHQPLQIAFELHPSVKDVVESQGIPHTAIFKLEINGKEESFNYNLHDEDHITVYPFEAVQNASIDTIFSAPESFIADLHLGKLAKTLRLLGFNTYFDKAWRDNEIISISNDKHAMILTRDLALLKDGNCQYGYWVRSTDPDQQIKELFERFSLAEKIDPFTRCMKCNGRLKEVELKTVAERIPPKVKQWHSIFFECGSCNQVYWQGSHYKKLKEKVDELSKIEH